MSAGEKQKQHLRYSMLIEWSYDDNAFVLTVPELPGCITHGSSYKDAVEQGQNAIESWIDAARSWGDAIPEPRAFTRSPA